MFKYVSASRGVSYSAIVANSLGRGVRHQQLWLTNDNHKKKKTTTLKRQPSSVNRQQSQSTANSRVCLLWYVKVATVVLLMTAQRTTAITTATPTTTTTMTISNIGSKMMAALNSLTWLFLDFFVLNSQKLKILMCWEQKT